MGCTDGDRLGGVVGKGGGGGVVVVVDEEVGAGRVGLGVGGEKSGWWGVTGVTMGGWVRVWKEKEKKGWVDGVGREEGWWDKR